MAWLDSERDPHIVDLIALTAPQCVKQAFRCTSSHFQDLIDHDSFYHVVISFVRNSTEQADYMVHLMLHGMYANSNSMSRYRLRSSDGVVCLPLGVAVVKFGKGSRTPLLLKSTKVLEVEWLNIPADLADLRSPCALIADSLPDFHPRFVLDYNYSEALSSFPKADTVFANAESGAPKRVQRLVFPQMTIDELNRSSLPKARVGKAIIVWSRMRLQVTSKDNKPDDSCYPLLFQRLGVFRNPLNVFLRRIRASSVVVVDAGNHESALRLNVQFINNRKRNLRFISLNAYLASLGEEEARLMTRWNYEWDVIADDVIMQQSLDEWYGVNGW